MKPDFGGITTLIGVLVSAVVSIYALWQTSKLQERLTHETGQLQANLTRETEALQERIRKDETTEASRRFVLDLWDRINGISEIDPQQPIGPDVRRALNALELIAMCWEGNIADKKMVELMFGKMYRNMYTAIRQIAQVPGMNSSGARLLDEGPPTIHLVYEELQKKYSEQGKIIGGT